MKAEGLLALYERVADAPDAIARLRRFVLDLAVRGKLVEQDSADEPASELLAAIDVRKRAHADATGVSRARKNHDAEVEEPPFTPPANWRWCRLGRLVLSSDAGWSPKTENHPREGEAWGVLKVSAVSWGRFDPSANKQLLPDVVPPLSAVVECGDFLISRANTAELVARSVVVHETPARLIMSDKIVRLKLIDLVDARYVCLVNNDAEHARSYYAASATGVSASMKNVSRDVILNLALPLPPLAEQHRIVAKVDELMALLDRLDAARSAREATRDRLTTASLTRLTAPDTARESLRTQARFALDALPALTTRADQIKQLRQTILNLAVRGRLVEQDKADEPATNLLLRIEEQRSALSLTSRQAPPRESEAPFPLPSGWRIARLGDLCSKTGSGSTPRGGKEVYRSSGVAFLRSQNVHNDGVRLDDVAYIDHQTHQRMSGTHVLAGDLLLNITGGSIGRCARVPHDFCDANLSQHVAIIRPAEPEIQRFLHWLILSPYFQSFVMDEQTGAGRGGLPKNRMDRILVPVPPLPEQHRIVAKVDELMALCDRLEAALQSADRTRASLLEALLHEALDSRADNLIDFAEARTRLRPTRSGVGSLIVHHQARRGQGGRIKLGKSLYFAEAHCGIALGGSFGRANFGPHDEWIYTFEREACHAGWFSVSERPLGDGKLRAEYTPGPSLSAKAEEARAGLGEHAAELERVLDLLAPLTAEEAEIAATLFAAWNDMLIEGGAVTDEVVITEVREHWHPSKARFTPEVLKQWLGWLRRNGLVPRGRGPSTRQQGRLI